MTSKPPPANNPGYEIQLDDASALDSAPVASRRSRRFFSRHFFSSLPFLSGCAVVRTQCTTPCSSSCIVNLARSNNSCVKMATKKNKIRRQSAVDATNARKCVANVTNSKVAR